MCAHLPPFLHRCSVSRIFNSAWKILNTLNRRAAVKRVAADQIKCACQNYWGPLPMLWHCLKLLQTAQKGIEEEPRSHLGMELVFSRTE